MKKEAKVSVITFYRPISKSSSSWKLQHTFFNTLEHSNELAAPLSQNDSLRIVKDGVKISFLENDFNLNCRFLGAGTIYKNMVKAVLNTEAIILDFRSNPNIQDDLRLVEKKILSILKTIRSYSSYSPITILFNPDDNISSVFDDKIHHFKFVTVITAYPTFNENNQRLASTDYEPFWQRIAADSFKPSLILELMRDQLDNKPKSKLPGLFHSSIKYPDTFKEALEDRRLSNFFIRNGYLTEELAFTQKAKKILQKEEIYDAPRVHCFIKNAQNA